MALESEFVVSKGKTIEETADLLAKAIKAEAALIALAGHTVEPDSLRLKFTYGSYDVTLKASRT